MLTVQPDDVQPPMVVAVMFPQQCFWRPPGSFEDLGASSICMSNSSTPHPAMRPENALTPTLKPKVDELFLR
ncbi:hypothetical protein STEG23_004561 [Scotinomys teguina]